MESIKLNTGAQIPVLGFGTWKIWPNGSAQKAVEQALEAGYRHIDTARVYGNEKGVGRGIKASGIDRKDIFVTTKLWSGNKDYESGLKAFDESLGRLGLDYVDLYLIHFPSTGKRQESWKALEQIHKNGKARAVGVSNYTVKHLEELLSGSSMVPAVNQVEFHPFLYKDQEQLINFCKKQGIVLEAYSPLAHGKRLHEPLLTEIAALYHRSTAQILLRWSIQHGTVPIVKTTHQERMAENLAVFDFELNDETMKAIDNLSDGTRTCWDPTNVA